MNNEHLIEKLEQELPPTFGRTEVERLMPGIISAKSLANKNSNGSGPPYYKHGSKVIYSRTDFLGWLSKRIVKINL